MKKCFFLLYLLAALLDRRYRIYCLGTFFYGDSGGIMLVSSSGNDFALLLAARCDRFHTYSLIAACKCYIYIAVRWQYIFFLLLLIADDAFSYKSTISPNFVFFFGEIYKLGFQYRYTPHLLFAKINGIFVLIKQPTKNSFGFDICYT